MAEVKAIEAPKGVEQYIPRFQSLYMRNSTFIKTGLRRDPPVSFNLGSICRSILGVLMNEYVYKHAQEWVKREDELVKAQPAACLFVAWAHHINETSYGICQKIDFMVPNHFNINFKPDKAEGLELKAKAYLEKLDILTFQNLLMEIAKCYKDGSIKIDWERFPNKKRPGETYPYDFIQWIGCPAGMGKRYYRLTMIDPTLTCDRILDIMTSELIGN